MVIGPMFAGKTTELMRRIRRYTVADHKCAVLKVCYPSLGCGADFRLCVSQYAADVRYSERDVCTHDGMTAEAFPVSNLFDADVSGFDVSICTF